MLDAQASAKQFHRPIVDDSAVRSPVANIHAGAAYAKSRLRIVPRLQGNLVGIHVADIVDVCVRQLRRSNVWRQVMTKFTTHNWLLYSAPADQNW